jgi:hypothetical protein
MTARCSCRSRRTIDRSCRSDCKDARARLN